MRQNLTPKIANFKPVLVIILKCFSPLGWGRGARRALFSISPLGPRKFLGFEGLFAIAREHFRCHFSGVLPLEMLQRLYRQPRGEGGAALPP